MSLNDLQRFPDKGLYAGVDMDNAFEREQRARELARKDLAERKRKLEEEKERSRMREIGTSLLDETVFEVEPRKVEKIRIEDIEKSYGATKRARRSRAIEKTPAQKDGDAGTFKIPEGGVVGRDGEVINEPVEGDSKSEASSDEAKEDVGAVVKDDNATELSGEKAEASQGGEAGEGEGEPTPSIDEVVDQISVNLDKDIDKQIQQILDESSDKKKEEADRAYREQLKREVGEAFERNPKAKRFFKGMKMKIIAGVLAAMTLAGVGFGVWKGAKGNWFGGKARTEMTGGELEDSSEEASSGATLDNTGRETEASSGATLNNTGSETETAKETETEKLHNEGNKPINETLPLDNREGRETEASRQEDSTEKLRLAILNNTGDGGASETETERLDNSGSRVETKKFYEITDDGYQKQALFGDFKNKGNEVAFTAGFQKVKEAVAKELGKTPEEVSFKEALMYAAGNQAEVAADYISSLPESLKPEAFKGKTMLEAERILENASKEEYNGYLTALEKVFDNSKYNYTTLNGDYRNAFITWKDASLPITANNMTLVQTSTHENGTPAIQITCLDEYGSPVGDMFMKTYCMQMVDLANHETNKYVDAPEIVVDEPVVTPETEPRTPETETVIDVPEPEIIPPIDIPEPTPVPIPTPTETEPETPDTPETEPETPETEPETSPETEPETSPETEPETPPETEPETPPETEPETPPETEPETPPETEPETPAPKSGENQQRIVENADTAGEVGVTQDVTQVEDVTTRPENPVENQEAVPTVSGGAENDLAQEMANQNETEQNNMTIEEENDLIDDLINEALAKGGQ
ncbi:hypothetical protein IJG20_02655 [Candidatus Saccharibacteria bacterium]|nr:hypothetical protein [Candidatus Saccharibacteria bacterium]